MNAIQTLLLQIAVILMLSRLLGLLMRYLHQPQVVGEMIAGIMLGPSLLGLIDHGRWMAGLFPSSSLENIEALSQLGVMLFMFLIGLELDPKHLHGQGRAAMVIGASGILIPFVAGGTLALVLMALQPQVTGRASSLVVLPMFMGAAMSITAFPVLARILTERNLHKTKSGTLALTCAAINDVMGWCVLAFVLAVAQVEGYGQQHQGGSSHALRSAVVTIFWATVYVAIMLFVVRRLLGRLQAHFETRGYLSQNVVAGVFLLLIASGLASDSIGIHQIFGAFMFGAVMPKQSEFIRHVSEKVEDFTVIFLLPLFFASTGLRTELGLLGSPHLWLICAVITLTAVAGKFGGVSLAARMFGMNWRRSALLGVLMNTRGLMELIILNIGLSVGVLSKPLFAMMVVMALATTFMTTPLMRLLYSPQRQKKELEEAAMEEAPTAAGMHVVVPVSNDATAASLIRIGGMLVANDPGRVYALHLDRAEEIDKRGQGFMNEADRVLELAQATARAHRIPINAVSYVSRNIGRDIADAAERYQASWVVMGWHKPVFFKRVLGGVVGVVLRDAKANVAVFNDKGLREVRRIIVPYLGEPQDRGALLAADRLSRLPDVKVTILHLVKPSRTDSDQRLSISTLVDKELPNASASGTVRMQVIEAESALDVAVEESQHYDLMVLGISNEWNLENTNLFGKQESLAQLSKCSLLIVHANPLAPRIRARSAPPGAQIASAQVS
jgi:Kef-type K+ transport system membrane component KefB